MKTTIFVAAISILMTAAPVVAQRGGGSPKPTASHGAQAPKPTTSHGSPKPTTSHGAPTPKTSTHAASSHGGSTTHGHSTAKAGASTHGGGHSTTKSTTSGSSVKTTKTTKKTAATTTTSVPTTTTPSTTTTPTTTTTLSPVQQKLQRNTKLASKLQSRLPAGTNLTVASSGFRNLGQFVAAVNVSNNIGIPFLQLKTRTVDQGM